MSVKHQQLVYPVFFGDRKFWKYSLLPPTLYMDRPKFSVLENSGSLDEVVAEFNPFYRFYGYKIHLSKGNPLYHALYIEGAGTIRLQTSSLVPLSFGTAELANGEKEPVIGICFVFIEEIRLALPQVAFDLYFTHRLQEIILETIAASLSGKHFDWQQHLRNAYGITCSSCRAKSTKGLSCPEACLWKDINAHNVG